MAALGLTHGGVEELAGLQPNLLYQGHFAQSDEEDVFMDSISPSRNTFAQSHGDGESLSARHASVQKYARMSPEEHSHLASRAARSRRRRVREAAAG